MELPRKRIWCWMEVSGGAAGRIQPVVCVPATARSVGQRRRQKLKTSWIEPALHKAVYASSSDVDTAVQQRANVISTDLLAT